MYIHGKRKFLNKSACVKKMEAAREKGRIQSASDVPITPALSQMKIQLFIEIIYGT